MTKVLKVLLQLNNDLSFRKASLFSQTKTSEIGYFSQVNLLFHWNEIKSIFGKRISFSCKALSFIAQWKVQQQRFRKPIEPEKLHLHVDMHTVRMANAA